MIVDDLKRLTGQILVNILSSLLRSRCAPVRSILAKRFIMQREERRVAAQRRSRRAPASFTLAQMIAYRQQFRGG